MQKYNLRGRSAGAPKRRNYSARHSDVTSTEKSLGFVGVIIAGFFSENLDIVKDCTIKISGYNAHTMDDFNPHQLITLCAVFIGFHVLAVPSFLWAMRHRQFTGREQKEWNLDTEVSPEVPVLPLRPGPLPAKARVMLGILSVLAVMMLGSVLLVLFTALHAAAHPATGVSPF
jgi:hypothetical protein